MFDYYYDLLNSWYRKWTYYNSHSKCFDFNHIKFELWFLNVPQTQNNNKTPIRLCSRSLTVSFIDEQQHIVYVFLFWLFWALSRMDVCWQMPLDSSELLVGVILTICWAVSIHPEKWQKRFFLTKNTFHSVVDDNKRCAQVRIMFSIRNTHPILADFWTHFKTNKCKFEVNACNWYREMELLASFSQKPVQKLIQVMSV